MEFFRIKKDIPFMKYALIFNVISFLTFALAVFFLVTRGLHLSVEFTGGTVMEVAYSQPAELAKVRETVSSLGYPDVRGAELWHRPRRDDPPAGAKGGHLRPAERASPARHCKRQRCRT